MTFTNAEKQRRFRARLVGDFRKRAQYLMKRRQWKKKKEDGRYVSMVQHGTNYETLLKTVQHERRVVVILHGYCDLLTTFER